MSLTPAQIRLLRAAANGLLVRTHGAQLLRSYLLAESGTLVGADRIRAASRDALVQSGLLDLGGEAPGLERFRGRVYEPTEDGRRWLDAHPA